MKIFIFLLLAGFVVTKASATGWKAGVAKVKITPQENMCMAGYAARDHVSEGVLLDLWAKALVLEDASGNRGVLFLRMMSWAISRRSPY